NDGIDGRADRKIVAAWQDRRPSVRREAVERPHSMEPWGTHAGVAAGFPGGLFLPGLGFCFFSDRTDLLLEAANREEPDRAESVGTVGGSRQHPAGCAAGVRIDLRRTVGGMECHRAYQVDLFGAVLR